MARFAHRHRRRLTLVSRFCPAAHLDEPPPVVIGKRNGRPRKKGAKLPAPETTVGQAARTPLEVAWDGGGRRDLTVVSDTGRWSKSGEGLVPVRWVFVRDETGTHRDDSFFSTATAMTPRALVATFTGRWSLETTFQEMRAYLGLETTFSDAITAVRRWLGMDWDFARHGFSRTFSKLPRPFQETMRSALAPAA
jgi:hypothetical protein